MTETVFRRPPRREPPPVAGGVADVRPAPPLPARQPGGPAAVLVLLPAVAGLGAMVLIFAAGGSGLPLAAGVLFGVSMVAVAAGQLVRVGGDRSRRIAQARRDYFRHLARVRDQARAVAAGQRSAATWRHPPPDALASLARTSRLWERRPADPDVLVLRLAVGEQDLALALPAADEQPVDEADPVAALARERLLRAHRSVPAMPVTLSLRPLSVVRFEGNLAAARGVVAALLLQAVCWHPPTELRIGVCLPPGPGPDRGRAWDWLKWTPHLADPVGAPGRAPVLAVATDLSTLEDMLAGELAGRPWAEPGSAPLTDRGHLIVLVDGSATGTRSGGQLAGPQGLLGVTVLQIGGDGPLPAGRGLRLRVTASDVQTVSVDRLGQEVTGHLGVPDQVTPAVAAATCRHLVGLRPPVTAAAEPVVTTAGLPDLLGLAGLRSLDPAVCWRPRPANDRLRVAIGVGGVGQPVELDLKEAAEGGMGPHGLIVGATGSGKSELLRTLVLGLAITHPPDVLNVVLVDFKGGATFARLDALPHTSAVVTNLGEHLDLVDRMADALAGELARRMQLLRAAGDVASLRDYHRARAGGRTELPAVPSLLVVVDEFSELLTAKPEFLDVFMTIGRVGRSLGVHLLLASQRLEEGRLRGLDTHLSYRIGLKTFSAAESRIVLGVDDAYRLPSAPGNGYLRFDTGEPVRFRAAYVSGPLRDRVTDRPSAGPAGPQVFRLTSGLTERPRPPAGPDPDPLDPTVDPPGSSEAGPPERAPATVLEVAVSRLAGAGVPAHAVWLPPLLDPPSLDLLLPATRRRPGEDFGRVPLGWVDRPFEQARGVLDLDLSGAAGHVAIVGAPQSGKSTALRTLIGALALTHGPGELSVYCLDLGGGSLATLAGLPQVGSVAGRLHTDLVRRTVAMVERVLAAREAAFAAAGVPSVADWRRRAAVTRTADLDPGGYGDLVLVVDGWGVLRETFEPLEARLVSIASRGLNYGIHLAVTATRWAELRPALRDLIGSRVELRLGDPLDSAVASRLAATVPAGRPGRGLTSDGHHLLTAVPRVDGRTSAEGLPAAVGALTDLVRGRWTGRAPEVRVLPATVRPADLPALPDRAGGVVLGLDEDLRPLRWDPADDRHLLVIGEERSGRSTVLLRLIRELTAAHGPDAARFLVFDPDRRLPALPFGSGQLLGSAATGREAAALIAAQAPRLAARLPAPGTPPDAAAARSWWGSPADVYLVVDNYERLAGAAPFAPLLPLLDHAGDIGLHLIVARQARGVARALYEGLVAGLRDTGCPAMLLSGPEAEGSVIGRGRLGPRPPGRGVWVPRRGDERVVQAVLEPAPAGWAEPRR
ncbi:type VII secretion protein EccCa [Nakamurella sp.]|uniref:type VII secretion protein EccCa n=1 Tax=Nakamurella sp. TaxID=1869182 RepID=UPI003B3A1DB1